jgi:hypothetical protein
LEDENVVGEDEIVKMVNKCFNPQAIVIDISTTCQSHTHTANWST